MITGLYSAATIVLGLLATLGPVGIILALIFVGPAVVLPMISKAIATFLECKVCIIVAAFIIASVVSFWIGHHEAYQQGVDDTVAEVARGDAKLVGRAKAARAKLLSCQEQGKDWDQSTGACQ